MWCKMFYIIVGWNDEVMQDFKVHTSFSLALETFQSYKRQFLKVSLYKIDVKFLTVTLIGEE